MIGASPGVIITPKTEEELIAQCIHVWRDDSPTSQICIRCKSKRNFLIQ